MIFKLFSSLVLAQLAVAQYDYGGGAGTTPASNAPAAAPSAPPNTDGRINVRTRFPANLFR